MMLAGEFCYFLDDHRSRRHVQTNGQSLCSENQFNETSNEALFDDFFECRNQTCMMRTDTKFKLIRKL